MKKFLISIFAFILLFSHQSFSQSPDEIEIENQILEAVHKYNKRELDEAREILVNVIEKDATNDAAWYYLAMASRFDEDMETSIEALKQAVAIDPDNFWYRYRLAALYQYADNLDATIEIYEGLMDDFPKKSHLYAEMADLYSNNADYEKALQVTQEMVNIFGMSEELALFQYRMAYLSGDQEGAIEYLRKYNEQYSSPKVLYLLADAEADDSIALAYYDEALRLDSSFSPALFGKAEICRVTHQFDEYFPILYRYLKAEDVNADDKAKYLLNVIEVGQTQFISSYAEQLDVAMEILAELYPDSTSINNLRGWYAYYMMRDDEALAMFRESVRIDPEDPQTYIDLLEYLSLVENWQEISVVAREAYYVYPECTPFMKMACQADYYLGDYTRMLEGYEILLQNLEDGEEDEKVEILTIMGEIYYMLGRKKEAFNSYDMALDIYPDYPPVLNNYAYYLSLEKRNLKKAYEMSRRSVELEPDDATYLDTLAWILFLQGKPQDAKPLLKKAMLHGGKENPEILDHYAEVLFELKEYDMAFVYWNLALQKDNGEVPGLKEKVEKKRNEIK